MTIVSKSISDLNDLHRILQFTLQHPEQSFHVIDLPYRLCSPAAQDFDNVRIWVDEKGELIGFAVVQLPFSTVDYVVQPQFEHLKDSMLQWATSRLEAVAKLRGEGFGFLLDSRVEDDANALKHDFVLDDWHMRNLALPLSHPLETPVIPEGFEIRLLNSDANGYVELHRAAFNTKNMSVDWRERTLKHPIYCPDLDLVAVNGDGKLIAFCIGWVCEINGQKVGQIEPVGVLPEFQKMGLGRAILLENLRRMRESGVETILVDAESYNPASQHLYERAGFRDVSRVVKYFRWFEPTANA
jgi:mycothiol synthase